MRAARLLQLLLILQNRGRQTSVQLAAELEVSPRTILRDVDAMTEAGLPIIVHQGNSGGIELGFNYRTRLTGLAADEAEALAVMLEANAPMISELELTHAAERAKSKLVESFPDVTRDRIQIAQSRFMSNSALPDIDPRVGAIAKAIRNQTVVRIRYASAEMQEVHPIRLIQSTDTWAIICARDPDKEIMQKDWGRINISAKSFAEIGDDRPPR